MGLGTILSGVLDSVTPQALHPLIDGAAAAADFSMGDPIGGTMDVLKTVDDLSGSGLTSGVGQDGQVSPGGADSYASAAAVIPDLLSLDG